MITANHSARRSDRSGGAVMLPVVLPVWDAKGDLVRVYVQVQAGRVRVSDDGWFLFDAVCAACPRHGWRGLRPVMAVVWRTGAWCSTSLWM